MKQVRRWRKRCEGCNRSPNGGLMTELTPAAKDGKYLCLTEKMGNKTVAGCLTRHVA